MHQCLHGGGREHSFLADPAADRLTPGVLGVPRGRLAPVPCASAARQKERQGCCSAPSLASTLGLGGQAGVSPARAVFGVLPTLENKVIPGCLRQKLLTSVEAKHFRCNTAGGFAFTKKGVFW